MTLSMAPDVESCEGKGADALVTENNAACKTARTNSASAKSAATMKSEDVSLDSSDADDLLVDEKMLKEEQAAREEREKSTKAKPAQALTKDRLDKLDQLLDKAQMYSLFLVEQVTTMQDQMDKPLEEAGKKRKAGSSANTSAKRTKGAAESVSKTMFPLINGELKDYQIKGVTWLISLWSNGMNGILADQMGLGKTVQTISFLSHLRNNKIPGPFLIVVPLSTISNWHKEFQRWCPSLPSIIYHGTKKERQEMERKWMKESYNRACPADMPVIITSFEIAMNDRKALSKLYYKYLVVDEGHRLKNSKCQLVRDLKLIRADNKLLLTGTPLQNNLAELWSLLNFLLPAVFNSLEDFESWFDFSAMVSSNEADTENRSKEILEAEAKNRMVSKLHEILKPFLLRRIKSDVEMSLPAKQEIVLYAPLTEQQKSIQSKLVNKTLISEITDLAKRTGQRVDLGKLNNILMQLRKNCNHPDIITSEWEPSAMFPPADTIVEQCGKMQLVERLLSKLKPRGHKVLIFSQFTRMLDILDSYLEERGHRACRIDGTMGYKERMACMDEFNGDPECFVFLLSTRAGGLGINLTSADTVIIYDSDWNPHQDMQAMDRAHRIGQTRPVLVLRLCTSDSVEIKLLKRATSKLALERLVIKKGAFHGHTDAAAPSEAADGKVALSAQDLLDVLQGNLRYQGAAQNETLSDDMLEKILDRTHLANKTCCPYASSGPGYELVEQQGGGLLSSVQ